MKANKAFCFSLYHDGFGKVELSISESNDGTKYYKEWEQNRDTNWLWSYGTDCIVWFSTSNEVGETKLCNALRKLWELYLANECGINTNTREYILHSALELAQQRFGEARGKELFQTAFPLDEIEAEMDAAIDHHRNAFRRAQEAKELLARLHKA